MCKVITSPVKRWPGTVTLPDWYDWGRLGKWQDDWDHVSELQKAEEKSLLIIKAQSESIFPMIDEWHLTGILDKPDRLPATPTDDALTLHRWLIGEINKVINGDEGVDSFLSGERTAGLPEMATPPES